MTLVESIVACVVCCVCIIGFVVYAIFATIYENARRKRYEDLLSCISANINDLKDNLDYCLCNIDKDIRKE